MKQYSVKINQDMYFRLLSENNIVVTPHLIDACVFDELYRAETFKQMLKRLFPKSTIIVVDYNNSFDSLFKEVV